MRSNVPARLLERMCAGNAIELLFNSCYFDETPFKEAAMQRAAMLAIAVVILSAAGLAPRSAYAGEASVANPATAPATAAAVPEAKQPAPGSDRPIGRRGRVITLGYFTVDDGATWFADNIEQIPPFMKDGKEAVRAYIFKCGDAKPFVAYLERYTPEAKKMLEEARVKMRQNPQASPDPALYAMAMGAAEVKKPNDPGPWAQQRDPDNYSRVVVIKPPDGQSINDLEPVMP